MIASRAESDDVSTPRHVQQPGDSGVRGELEHHRRLVGKRIIDEQARRQVRTFLDELKNGTRNYRTVASLGGQVVQEYRGRAILELLQNAHDVLAFADNDDPRRISFHLRLSPEPQLLVANSGRPFRRADFRGLCQLAQSPKDPNESVGNKGLGFQSVLELSTRPEVWSTTPADSDAAFVFGFDPDVHKPIGRVARALVNGDPPTDVAFGTEPVVDWSPTQTDEYRQRLSQDGIDPAEEVTKYLSPYVVPRFLGDPPPEVAELLEDGHVTVIRLPLDGGKTGSADEAIESIREQLRALDEAAMVFLRHLSVLRIDIDDEVVELKREVDSERTDPASGTRKERLLVSRTAPDVTDPTERAFHVWSRVVGGDAQPEEMKRISRAVRHLPNRWPEVRRVEVAVAVEETREARKGVFVIFLPTRMRTGVGAHINAPFYGSLDRRQINFADGYNELLLEFVTGLMLDAVAELVNSDPEPWRGRAVIDLLAQVAEVHAFEETQPLADRLRERAHNQDRPLDALALILCDDGWHRPRAARTMPTVQDDTPIQRNVWRSCAGFTVASTELDERRDAVRGLLQSFGGSPNPTDEEWANTLERLADQVSQRKVDADWNQFLGSVLAVLPSKLRSEPRQPDTDLLADARFLPTEDGRVLSASSDVRIFFRPRRGVDDAADFVGSVPDSLKKRFAFLHPEVRTLEGQPQRNTEVQKFLDGRFVQGFGRGDLLRNVVVQSLPKLPVTHESPKANECGETLAWTLKMIGEEEQESLDRWLARLPVACFAGWFPMREAVFGPGWDDRGGDDLKTLADALPDEEGERLLMRALLSPDDRRWGIDMADHADLFARAGVVTGLRLQSRGPTRFRMSGSSPKLPAQAPSTLPKSAWNDWKRAVRGQLRPDYWGEFEYELKNVKLLSLLQIADLGDPARAALSNLILASLVHWEEGWDEVTITKKEGRNSTLRITSPLKHWLETLPWLDDGPPTASQPLRQRWLVPESLIRGQSGRFRHLTPLSLELAQRLAKNEKLLQVLKELGLNVYPTEDDRTGSHLLEALAGVVRKVLDDEANARDAMPAGGFDVLLGQVRHAWRHFNPDEELPRHFVVRTRPRTFEVRTADGISDAYLPDHAAHTRSLREHTQPILAMRPEEGRGEVGALLHEKGARRASGLEERCFIDGRPAIAAREGAQAIETSLDWLPVVLLALAAHGGTNPRGPATDAWLKAKDRLQRARVVHCGSIEVELLEADGHRVAHRQPSAYWMSQEETLLLNREVVASGSYERIAQAAQAILDRQDLLKDLRLVLSFLAGAREPSPADIAKALDRAEIDEHALADIRDRWGGVRVLRDRVRPVVRLLDIPDNGLNDASDVAALAAWLSEGMPRADGIPRWSTEDLLTAARESRDDFEMGLRAWEALGDAADLPKWNKVLGELGRPTVKNSQAGDQAKRHLDQAARSLRALARHVATDAGDQPSLNDRAALFSRINAVHDCIERGAQWSGLCEAWSDRWWAVPFGEILHALSDRYMGISVVRPYLKALDGVMSTTEFDAVLASQGVDLECDPMQVARGNRNRLRGIVRRARRRDGGCSLWELYQAWRLYRSDGEADSVLIEEAPDIPTEATMYFRELSEDELFDAALRLIDDRNFRDACIGCGTTEEVNAKLKIPDEFLERVVGTVTGRVNKRNREKRTFTVADEPYEVDGPETYGDLLRRLEDRSGLPRGPRARRDRFTDLKPIQRPARTKLPPSGKIGRTPNGKTPHPSPHIPELVGIVGEMHAYRFLRSEFGIDERAWVSEFRTKVLPLLPGERDETSDSLGYDFEFSFEGKTWCVEVKATTEDGTSFDLSMGEVAAAVRIATSRDERWRILRVRKALTTQPECDWLPNPFGPGADRYFRRRQGSLTVEYAPSTKTDNDRGDAGRREGNPVELATSKRRDD